MTKHRSDSDDGEWIKVGSIGVDAGMVWIGDPCYVLHKDGDEKPKSIGKDWNGFCDRVHASDVYPRTVSFPFDAGDEGLGVCVSSGFGDGTYDVMARVAEIPGWGKRVCEVRIVFVDDEEEEEDEVSE